MTVTLSGVMATHEGTVDWYILKLAVTGWAASRGFWYRTVTVALRSVPVAFLSHRSVSSPFVPAESVHPAGNPVAPR